MLVLVCSFPELVAAMRVAVEGLTSATFAFRVAAPVFEEDIGCLRLSFRTKLF